MHEDRRLDMDVAAALYVGAGEGEIHGGVVVEPVRKKAQELREGRCDGRRGVIVPMLRVQQ